MHYSKLNLVFSNGTFSFLTGEKNRGHLALKTRPKICKQKSREREQVSFAQRYQQNYLNLEHKKNVGIRKKNKTTTTNNNNNNNNITEGCGRLCTIEEV